MPIYEQQARTPERFHEAELIAKDFDNTEAHTFEASPNGIDAIEACNIAIDGLFGVQILGRYISQGGLQNRAPLEVVQDLAPDASGTELDHLVSQFVDTKLDVLIREIGARFPDGSVWPRPTAGFLPLLDRIAVAQNNGRPIEHMVISSGHERFIRKTYDVWGALPPSLLVTHETIESLMASEPIEELVKPSPRLMVIARDQWRQSWGVEPVQGSTIDERSRMLYVGDDPHKDGEFAKNSGVDFMLLNPEQSARVWRAVAVRFGLGELAVSSE